MSNIPPVDRYVAWARYNAHDGRSATTLHLCDSDAPGAFRLYRWPDVPQHDDRASLRHFLSAALVFGREGDAHARTMAAFDEWFRLHDGAGVLGGQQHTVGPDPSACAGKAEK
jgi:hypothetical protein